MTPAWPSLIIAPQSAVGGCTPRPRNDSAASSASTYPKFSVDCAPTIGVTFGSTRRSAIHPPENPCTRYAATYGRAALGSDERPRESRDERRVGDAHRDDRRHEPLAEQRDRHDRDEQRGEREEDVEDAAERRVDPAAAPSGERGRAGCRGRSRRRPPAAGPAARCARRRSCGSGCRGPARRCRASAPRSARRRSRRSRRRRGRTGAMSGANIAASVIDARGPPGDAVMNERLPRRTRGARRTSDGHRRGGHRAPAPAADRGSIQGSRMSMIGVHDDERGHDEQDDRLHDGEVEPVDRLHEQRADAGEPEGRLRRSSSPRAGRRRAPRSP